jgi:hypothetical protein
MWSMKKTGGGIVSRRKCEEKGGKKARYGIVKRGEAEYLQDSSILFFLAVESVRKKEERKAKYGVGRTGEEE